MVCDLSKVVERYRRIRNKGMLRGGSRGQYAFVGVGAHALDNLYPVLAYLGVRLKYVCCKSPGKLELVRRRFAGVRATLSVDEILGDPEVAGVFVSTPPAANYGIAAKVLGSGKPLFVEKPPCRSADGLGRLIEVAGGAGVKVAVAGMQKRCSPITGLLKAKAVAHGHVTYNMKYLTGLYPDGDVLTELFIHPVDYVCYLFGEAEIFGMSKTVYPGGGLTLMLMLGHRGASGMLELSTAYTWANARESITVNTPGGCYCARQMEELTFSPRRGSLLGLPLEKVFRRSVRQEVLFRRNNFVPAMPNNSLYAQGFYGEIKEFVDVVEHGRGHCRCSLDTLRPTFSLLDDIRQRL